MFTFSLASLLPEFGSFLLVIALLLCLGQALLPWFDSGQKCSIELIRSISIFQLFVIWASFAVLIACLLLDDFTVLYVIGHANSQLPWYYKVSAAWGGHEGSLLLWIALLASWGACLAWSMKRSTMPFDDNFQSKALSIFGLVLTGFLAFLILTSNPFARSLPWFPIDGNDLNPLLQDFGLIIHPPMLYMGYVGFAVPFSLAIAGMLTNQVDSLWAKSVRPWVLTTLAFLTMGIALGSWWAYYELGWGGWWFWDPVENASLMPWLIGVALLHMVVVTEKRSSLKAWTLLLSILAFGLSLLGTFLVRSGVLTSVHSFASDPARGVFILGLLAFFVGGALLLFALKADKFPAETRAQLFSKEVGLLIANVLWITLLFVVVSGTLLPLLDEALGYKLSVGAEYYNQLFAPIGMGLLSMLIVVPFFAWNKNVAVHKHAMKIRLVIALICIAAGFVLSLILKGAWQSPKVWLSAGLIAAVFYSHVANIMKRTSSSTIGYWATIKQLPSRYWAMMMAHAGVLVFAIGIIWVSYADVERDVLVVPNQVVELGDYEFTFVGTERKAVNNYRTTMGEVKIVKNGELATTLYPEKRTYNVGNMVMTEASIDAGLWRDLYVALGEPVDEQSDSWALRVYYKPMIRWVWLGCIFMALGCLLAVRKSSTRKA